MEGASRRLALLEGHLVSYETYADAAIERNRCAAAAAAPGAAPAGAGPVVLIGGMVMDLQVRVEGTDDAALCGEYAGHVIKPQVDVQPPKDVPEPSAMCDTSCRLALAVPPMCSAAAQSPAGCRSLQVGRAAASGELLKSKVASSCTCQHLWLASVAILTEHSLACAQRSLLPCLLLRPGSGGVARNVAEALALLLRSGGAPASRLPLLVSAVGDDLAGRSLLQHWESLG